MSNLIFLNYRRGDDPGFATALYARLERQFGSSRLFMDVEGHIRPGDEFIEVLKVQVQKCAVMLVVIGPRWVDMLEARHEDPNDFVVIEIEEGLKQGKRVIPILVGGAAMPAASEVPERLRRLVDRQAVHIRPDRFGSDVETLIAALKRFLPSKFGLPRTSPAHVGQWFASLAGLPIALLLVSGLLTGALAPGQDFLAIPHVARGPFFGLLLGFLAALYWGYSWWRVAIVISGAWLAYLMAADLFANAVMRQAWGMAPGPDQAKAISVTLVWIVGAVAGLVGSGVTGLAILAATPGMTTVLRVVLASVVGVALGAVLTVASWSDLAFDGTWGKLLLYTVWQVAVGAVLLRRPEDMPRPAFILVAKRMGLACLPAVAGILAIVALLAFAKVNIAALLLSDLIGTFITK